MPRTGVTGVWARAENAPMRLTRATIAIVLALLLPAAVGCGSSSGGSSSSPAAAVDNGESAKAPGQILSDVNDAVRGAKSVHMSGAMNSDSSDIGFDVMLSWDAAKGTLTLSGNEIKLVRVGDAAYFSGSPEFYKTLGGGDAAANLLQGRWIKIPSTDSRFAVRAVHRQGQAVLEHAAGRRHGHQVRCADVQRPEGRRPA